ncbi:MAG: hypothetical protein HC883_06385, partial [Bdellovibrionaceae bacterium]|nr:hypothetical protein [Pseudobdellovibrionaceae bacterium]
PVSLSIHAPCSTASSPGDFPIEVLAPNRDGRPGPLATSLTIETLRPGAVADKFIASNRRTTLFCQIETEEGVENADAMAALDGVDCLWVGHFDLSVSAIVDVGLAVRNDQDFVARQLLFKCFQCGRRPRSLRFIAGGALGTEIAQEVAHVLGQRQQSGACIC